MYKCLTNGGENLIKWMNILNVYRFYKIATLKFKNSAKTSNFQVL